DPATDLTQSPPAYHLFGLEARVTKQMTERQSLSLSLSIDNLLDTEYKEYTNRARYYSHDVGQDVHLALHWHF
ncbi:MAG: TonB-dependent receptor, partial [Porphyromonadaceae bacterium]|nr:TonB-dependent receptor [Porphyromonadaceae bacterium]